ncbi:response regulator [Arcobacter roscoffensis]|uniref:Response regulator n=1 Tax=Arcobacter roscoffensis TaxID=2961520 RepID=A0ABY5E6S5_9BACT|nr:response regulator [Arcobacter roscoffensis]UTJ06461.1 response regulator [Arcobacter roscoffensis]
MKRVDFFKLLTVIYVEDDTSVREYTSEAIKDLFKELYTAKNGQEAIEIYDSLVEKKQRVDVIISDINMPKLNGIELLKEIRTKNEDLPFIFTTAFTEEKYLLEAITHNATEYILKPIDIRNLIDKIYKASHSFHQQDTIIKQKKELEKYLNAIDNVAIVSKTDTKGKIKFANDIFCKMAQYSIDELYGKPHNIVRHPDMPKAAFENLWKTIKSGETWQGKVKNRAKDGSAYYVNATIIPIFDDFGDEIIEYVGIRFLTTNDELEKREFKKKVLQNIQETKKQHLSSQKRIKLLEEQLTTYTNIDLSSLNKDIFDLKQKCDSQNIQLNYYEDELKNLKDKNSNITTTANTKVKKASVIAINLKNENTKLQEENKILKKEIEMKKKVLIDLEQRLTQKNKYIEDLKDVINFKEKELGEVN